MLFSLICNIITVLCEQGVIMNNLINNRIKELLAILGIKQTDMAKKLNVSRELMSSMVNGRRTATDRTIKDICRVYEINEDWLVNGTGEVFQPTDDELFELIGEKANEISDNMSIIIKMILRMSDNQREVFDNFVDEFLEEKQKRTNKKHF